jgi:molybdopterin converting factor small subunit
MMDVVVEFIGVSRILTKISKVELHIPEQTTYNQIVKVIAEKQPGLLGKLIDPETFHFYGSNMFHLNGEKMIRTDEMDEPAQDGDRLALLSIFTGGEGRKHLSQLHSGG